MKNKLLLTSIAAAALAGSAPAYAQEDSPVTLSGGVTLVSDYRFRGVSLSGEDPAVQGTVNVNFENGFYVGTWASSLEEDLGYGSTEFDFYAGYKVEVAPGTAVDAGLVHYTYFDAEGLNYFEPYASITTTLGPASAKLGAAYAWKQDAIGGDDNIYVYGDLSGAVPDSPFSLRAHLGYSDGSLAYVGNYLDWNIGADLVSGPVTFSVSYIDTDLPRGIDGADAALVFGVSAAF